MPSKAEFVRIELRSPEQMRECREALLDSGVTEDTLLMRELATYAHYTEKDIRRGKKGRELVPYNVLPMDAELVLTALNARLRNTPFEQQTHCITWQILDHAVHVVPEAA